MTNSVSHHTDIVFVGKHPGSKYEKAKKLGIAIEPEEKLWELLKEAGIEA